MRAKTVPFLCQFLEATLYEVEKCCPVCTNYDRSYSVAVPDMIDDGNVAFNDRQKNVVGWSAEKSPQRDSGEPHTTDELIPDAVAWHTGAVHLGSSCQ